MAKLLLAETTSAGQTPAFSVAERREATVIFHGSPSTAEYADLQISHDRGTSWTDLYKDGAQVRLASDNRAITIYGPGTFRVDKDATTGQAGISLSTNQDL